MGYETRRAANDGGGPKLAAATGLLGKEKQAKAAKRAKKKGKRGGASSASASPSPRKKEFQSPSKSALEQALSGFDTPSDHGGKMTPDLMAKEAIHAAEEFMRCNSVPEGLVTAKDGLAGALPALAVRHAEMRAPGPIGARVQWEHSVGSDSGKETPGGFASYDTFGLDLPQTPPDLAMDPEYRQELMRAADASAAKKMRSAKKSYDAKVAKANNSDFSRHSLSPLRTDPKLAARNLAASAKAAATAHPWRGSTPELDGWTKNPYVPHAEEVRYSTPKERANEVGRTTIPVQFHKTIDDPIFPSLEAELMEVSINDDGTFKKTVFPTKRPNRRSQIAALAESLDQMLEVLEAEDAKKQAEMNEATEQERLKRSAADREGEELSPEEVERRAKADVEKETASVSLMIDRLEREDQVVQKVLGEMQRQIALQSKDRANLLQRVGTHYHTLVERAVGVSKMGDAMHDEQIEKVALLNAQMDALRKKFESQVLTTEDRETRISELLSTQKDLEAELVKARSKTVKAERAREKALKEAAGGRALMQENADFKHLNDDLEKRVRDLSNLVEETNLDVQKYKKMWEMEKGITADLQDQLQKEQRAPRATGTKYQGKRPVRAVRKSTVPTNNERLAEIIEQERALRAKQDQAGEKEKLAMQRQMDKLQAERLAAEQHAEANLSQAETQQAFENEDGEDDDDQPTREMTKEEEALEDEMEALQKAMTQKAKRVKGLMSDDIENEIEPDDAHAVGIATILGDHVDSDDAGEISEDDGEISGDAAAQAQKESGAAKLAQMQLAKMQREMAAMEAKLAKATANRQRLQKEHRQMKEKLESGRLSKQEAEDLMDKLAETTEAESEADAQESKMQSQIDHAESLRVAIVTAEDGDVEATVAEAVQASLKHKQSAIAEADESIHHYIEQETSMRQDLAQLEGLAGHEDEEQQLREKLMDNELKRTQLVTIRENAAADFVLEQAEAAEMGLKAKRASGTQSESMDVYTVRQFQRTVGRLHDRVATHKANLTRDKQRETLLLKRVKEMKAQMGGGDTPWDEAVRIQGQLIEDEVELGAIGFHQNHETAELKVANSWIVRLEDGKRAADGVSRVLAELLAYFQDRKHQINQALAVLAIESQRNSTEETDARNELATATQEDRPECERKLGALEAQRVKLVEMNLALNDEITYCNAELLEMQTQHAATVAMDAKDRAVQMAEQNEASLHQQIQEQSMQLLQGNDRMEDIATAEIKLNAALRKGGLSEQDTKDAQLQLRDLEMERKFIDAKQAQLTAQQDELTKAKVEFEAAAKEAKSHGSTMAVRKLVEGQLARSEKAVLDVQTELDKAEIETQRLDRLADTSNLHSIEMESAIRQRELLKQRVADLTHSLDALEDEARMRKAQVADMRAAEVEAAETVDSGGASESHRITQVRAELEARNQQADAYEAKVQEILLKEQLLKDQIHDERDDAGKIAAELEIIAIERERAIELRHSCAEEIKELNTIAAEHSQMQSTQKEIEELAAAIDTTNKGISEFHKEELHLRRKIESGILTGSDLQQATDRLTTVRAEAHELERARHENSLAIQTAQEQLQDAEEKASKRHQDKLVRAEEEVGATQVELRTLQKEEAQLMHELDSSSQDEEVQVKLGKLAIRRRTLEAKLAAEASVKKHVAEKHDAAIKEKIVHVHHFKNTQHAVATEGYDHNMKLQRPDMPDLSVKVAETGVNTSGFPAGRPSSPTVIAQNTTDSDSRARVAAATTAQRASEASAAQQTAIASTLASASQEAQKIARRAQEEAISLRSNMHSMDEEIENLRRQLASQHMKHAQQSASTSTGKTLATAADIFDESTEIIAAAKETVNSVRTIIDTTPALKSHEELKEPCIKLDAVCAKMLEHSERIVAVASAPATKLAVVEIQRQEIASQLAQKEASVTGIHAAPSIDSHATALSIDSYAKSTLTAQSSEHSALAQHSKEVTITLEQDQAKLQEILEEERALAASKEAAQGARGNAEEERQLDKQLLELKTKKDEATQRINRQHAVKAQAITQHAEALLSEPLHNPSADIAREKARLHEILAKERAMRDNLNSFSINESEKEKLQEELEQLEVKKTQATSNFSRTVSTNLAEKLLSETPHNPSADISHEKARLQEILAKERALRDELNSSNISDDEKERLQEELEQVEVNKTIVTSDLGRAETLQRQTVTTSTPMLDKEKERLQTILAQEKSVRAALEAASAADQQRINTQLEQLQEAKVESTQRIGQHLYEIQVEQTVGQPSGSIQKAVAKLPSLDHERNQLNALLAQERELLAAKVQVENEVDHDANDQLQAKLARLEVQKTEVTQRMKQAEQQTVDHEQHLPYGAYVERAPVDPPKGSGQQLRRQTSVSGVSVTSNSTKGFAAELEQEIAGEESLRSELEQANQLVQQLGAQNRELEDKVSTLGSSLFRSTQDQEQLQKQLTETLKAVRNFQERKAEETKIGPSQADVDAANKKMLRYRELLKVSEQDVLLVQERLMRSMNENKSLQAEIYDAKEDVATMQQQVKDMRADVVRFKKERDGLVKQVALLEEQLAAAQLEAAKVKDLENERDELLARIKALEKEIDEKNGLIRQLQEDAAELGRKLAQAMLDLEESERLRAEAEAKVAELEAAEAARAPDSEVAVAESLELMLTLAVNTAEMNRQRKEQVAAVRSDLKLAEKERDEALAALDEAKKALAALQAQVEADKFANGQKDARIAELEARVAELEARVDELEARVAELEKALAAAQADVDMLRTKLAKAEEDAARAAKMAADAASKAATADAAAAAQPEPQTPVPDSSAELAAAQSENDALKKRIKELLEEIDKLTAALKMTNEALAAAEQQRALQPASNDDAVRALRASMAELTAALAEAQAEAARLRRLNEQLEAALAAAGATQPEQQAHQEVAVKHVTETETKTETVVDDAQIERMRQEIEDLKRQLRDALEREALLQEELAGAKALIEQLQSKQDERDMERVQWEKEKRDEFQSSMVATTEKGSQTDSEEYRLQLAAEKSSREISRGTHDERARHKPRFLVPETADASHENRDCKPLRWLLRLIRSIYDDKYLADAVDNRHNHPHDPLPEFIFVWTAKRYGLRDLVAQTRWDIANAANAYDDVPEVRTFLSFVQEAYDTEQLSFYLYARAVVHDRSCSNINEKRLQDSSKRETGTLAEMRYMPLSLVQELVTATFSERLSPNNREAILAYAETEAVMWTPPDQEQAPAMQGMLSSSGGSLAATQTLTTGMNATLNTTSGKGTFQSAFGVGKVYGGNEELPVVLDEARVLELLMQAYTADRASYDVRIGQIFAETDIDGDGEIDKDDFVRFVASAVPQWSAGHAKEVFWKVTGALGKEVLDMDGILYIAREYELFNGALQIPKFTSEDEVLSAGELELVWNAIANHRSYLDQGFVRKMTARWQRVYKMGGSTSKAGKGKATSPLRGRSPDRGTVPQRYVLDTDGAIPQNAIRKDKYRQQTTRTTGVGREPVDAGVPREYIDLGTTQGLEGDIGQWEDAGELLDHSLPILGPSETNGSGTFEPRVQQGVSA